MQAGCVDSLGTWWTEKGDFGAESLPAVMVLKV